MLLRHHRYRVLNGLKNIAIVAESVQNIDNINTPIHPLCRPCESWWGSHHLLSIPPMKPLWKATTAGIGGNVNQNWVLLLVAVETQTKIELLFFHHP